MRSHGANDGSNELDRASLLSLLQLVLLVGLRSGTWFLVFCGKRKLCGVCGTELSCEVVLDLEVFDYEDISSCANDYERTSLREESNVDKVVFALELCGNNRVL